MAQKSTELVAQKNWSLKKKSFSARDLGEFRSVHNCWVCVSSLVFSSVRLRLHLISDVEVCQPEIFYTFIFSSVLLSRIILSDLNILTVYSEEHKKFIRLWMWRLTNPIQTWAEYPRLTSPAVSRVNAWGRNTEENSVSTLCRSSYPDSRTTLQTFFRIILPSRL